MLAIPAYTLLAVLTVDLLATSGDIHMSWTSPIFPKLQSNDSQINPLGGPISDGQQSLIGSLVNIGALIGPLPYGYFCDRYGRKMVLLLVAVPHIISYITFAFAQEVWLYYLARFLGGIAVGGGYTLLPLYVAEISDDINRGQLSATLNVFWAIGNLIPYILGPYINIKIFNLILMVIPSTFFCLFLLIAPESPYYLIKNKQMEKAEKCLKKLKNRQLIDDDIKHIEDVLRHDEHADYKAVFIARPLRRALFISVMLIIFQQLSGINAVLFYTEIIFQATGTDLPPDISSLIVALIIFPSSFFAPFLSDRWGRKPLLLVSAVGMTAANLLFGLFFYLKSIDFNQMSIISWVPIFSLSVYVLTFNMGFGPLPWTVTSEIFPLSVRSTAASITSSTCWLTSFLVTQFFTSLTDLIGIYGTFWLFTGACVLAAIFVILIVPETKGKSFKEIQLLLEE